MSDLIIDLNIETIPNPQLTPDSFMGKIKLGNRKDPDKIMERQLEGSMEKWRKCATHPLQAWVFVVTTLVEGEDKPMVIYNSNEIEVMREFEQFIIDHHPTGRIQWHTFNGLSFDFSVLRLRGLKYRLPNVTREMTCPKYGDQLHVDWMTKFSGDLMPKEGMGLDDYATFFGLSRNNPITGKDILDHYRGPLGPDWEAIRAHSESRVLYLRDFRTTLKAAA